jgi:hypothetical protein
MDYLINIVVSGGIAFAIVKFTAEGRIDFHFKKKLQEHENNLAIATEREKVKYQKDIHQYTLYSNTRHEIIPELYKRALWAKEKTSILNGPYIVPNFNYLYPDKNKVLRQFENADQQILEELDAVLKGTDQEEIVVRKLGDMYLRNILLESLNSIHSYSEYLFFNALFIEENIFDRASSLRESLQDLHLHLRERVKRPENHSYPEAGGLSADELEVLIDEDFEELKSLCRKEIGRT